MPESYIRAKQDKPGIGCSPKCMYGTFCQRWWVLSATGISQCAWLNLEAGVIVKFSAVATELLLAGQYAWFWVDVPLGISYRVQRRCSGVLNDWLVVIIQAGCLVVATIPQDEDAQLWTGAEDVDFTAFGTCAAFPPIETLSLKSYRTQKAALADFPDLAVWDWS